MHPRKRLEYVSSHFQDAAKGLRLNSTSRLWLKAVKGLFNCQARLPPAELSPHVTTSLQLHMHFFFTLSSPSQAPTPGASRI